MDKFICFIHIPKAAGITFQSILRRSFKKGYKRYPNHFQEGIISKETMRALLERGTYLKAVGGHRFSADLPYDFNAVELIGIAFVRDPVERLISDYYYSKDLKKKTLITESNSLEEFVSSVRANLDTDRLYHNGQSQRIGLPLNELSQKIDSGQLHIFPTERFDEAVISLNKGMSQILLKLKVVKLCVSHF